MGRPKMHLQTIHVKKQRAMQLTRPGGRVNDKKRRGAFTSRSATRPQRPTQSSTAPSTISLEKAEALEKHGGHEGGVVGDHRSTNERRGQSFARIAPSCRELLQHAPLGFTSHPTHVILLAGGSWCGCKLWLSLGCFGEGHAFCFCRTRVFRQCCRTRHFCWVSRSHAAQARLRESPTTHRYRRVHAQLPAMIPTWFLAAL